MDALGVNKERKGSFTGCSSPLYCGFAPTIPVGLNSWESARAVELEDNVFKKFEELWEAKWHGDGGPRAECGSQVDLRKASGKKAHLHRLEGSVKRKHSREKFQLAEGFEDWGIPQYPEDYVDPAELSDGLEMYF